ncbi:MAG: nucleoside kinase [Lachnospiraceae bacterium]|nr:nucleoside kinase [Lachnospiraceae bacterium]
MYRVKVEGEEKTYPEETKLIEIAKEYQKTRDHDIVLAMVDYKLSELGKNIENGSRISFLTTDTVCGNETYRRSLVMVMLKAFYDVYGTEIDKIEVQYSISKGYYCEVKGQLEISEEVLACVRDRMNSIISADIPFEKRVVSTNDAVHFFHEHGMYDKERLFRFRRSSRVNIYRINKFEDYFYGYMVPSTGYLKYYGLYAYDEGFVLQMPVKEKPEEVPEFRPQEKVFQILKESSRWSDLLEVGTVGALNEQISRGKTTDLMLVQEALQEQKIAEIAKQIAMQKGIKFVMIAGPSSSGKTTFSHRLSIQLRACGLHPHPIEVDNYFVNREKNPKDKDGNYDFEALEAIDVDQFNEDMGKLLRGEKVELPVFDFKMGRRVYKGNWLQLGKDDILVIEGIHCLNDKLSYTLPKESKFKIYISALTQLNIDEHNRISTTDCRLIRRIVRDARTRGTSAEETLARWQSVRNGEERNIFPYQEQADVMFNSALIYELAVLKQYVEPLLFGIPVESPYYTEAKRMLKFMDYFLGVSSDIVPTNSLLREFIGGSCFS